MGQVHLRIVALVLPLTAAATPCLADAIVTIVNKSSFGVTVNVDGAYGCRAETAAGAKEADVPDTCTFGAALGSHALELRFDNGNTAQRTIDVPAKGYVVNLTGTE